MSDKILIADDEPEILEILKMLLSKEGYEVITARNGEEAVSLADPSIDLYLLDVNMPIMSGFAAGAKIREMSFAPIIFLTAYSGETDKYMGFSAGADDYIVKPFSHGELLMRIRALLRRSKDYSIRQSQRDEGSGGEYEGSSILYKDICLDLNSQTVIKKGNTIPLTYTEFKILELLLTHRKKIYSIENIYQSIWEEEAVGDGAIMVHIKNLRKKLGDSSRSPVYIKTAWGKGYYAD